ncbi:hypothetical protein [Vulgatibacter sp.]|uniref:hypothetical protein n=1 Tax=Vulgatibacter sp. TaxID=1971226 RepID=UPI0035691825
MVPFELLPGGAERCSVGGCTYVVTRLRPGALLVSVHGDDRGAAGDWIFERLGAEARRFARPLRLFVDLREARGAAPLVQESWTAFFRERRSLLERVTLLTAEPWTKLVVAIARHLAGAEGWIDSSNDPAAFSEAIGGRQPALQLEAKALPLSLERAAGAVEIAGAGASFRIERLAPGVLGVRVAGADAGELPCLVFDAVEEMAGAGRYALFIDASAATEVHPPARELWTAWLTAQRQRLDAVHSLVRHRYLQLTVGTVHELSRTGDRMQVHADPASFERARASRVAARVRP